MALLNWPPELATHRDQAVARHEYNQSLRLDLHGDPLSARLVVCSDGNHHMALEETLQTFARINPGVGEIFYTTTPPRIALQIAGSGGLQVGNFRLAVKPHVFISPPQVMERLAEQGRLQAHTPFMRGRGVVLLVPAGNPKNITSIRDLLRDDVRLFLSNPETETVSYQLYTECLRRLASQQGLTLAFLAHAPGKADPAKLVYGESIHHREAPQAVADGRADAALVFYHLGLRYQRIFPGILDFVWPEGSLGNQNCDTGTISCGLMSQGGEWGAPLYQFLMSDTVTDIYRAHGLERP